MNKLTKVITQEYKALDLKLCYTHGEINESQYDKLRYLLHKTRIEAGSEWNISENGIQVEVENIEALIKGISKDMQKFQKKYGKGYTYCYMQPRKEIISLLEKLHTLAERENVECIHYRTTNNEYYPSITQWNLIF